MGNRFIAILITFAISLTFNNAVISQSINIRSAENAACQFLDKIRAFSSSTFKKNVDYKIAGISTLDDPENNLPLGYVIHLLPQGFMVVSAWADRNPLISYSLVQKWPDNFSVCSVYAMLLYSDLRALQQQSYEPMDGYVEKNISALSGKEVFYQWPEEGTSKTSGWVETTWIQGWPYNQFCPVDTLDNNRRCAVGCVATAMAQVINYHQNIGAFRFDDSDTYISPARGIHFDSDSSLYAFPGFNRLNTYLRKIATKYDEDIPLNDADYAALCLATGIATKLNYRAPATSPIGTSQIYTASLFKEKLDYHSADFLLAKNNFQHVLIDNMMNGLPAVIYLINHAIVADGYNTAGYVHLNFGWCCDRFGHITQTWYKSDGSNLPEPYLKFESGIINIKPEASAYDLRLTASTDRVFLPCTKIGQTSTQRRIILTNVGSVVLRLDDIIIPENFSVSPLNGFFDDMVKPIFIKPKEEFELMINCSPDTIGKYTGRLQILASYNGALCHLDIDLCAFGVGESGTTVTVDNIPARFTAQGSPYYICNNIIVPDNQTLRIEAGAALIFTGPYQITVGQNSRFVAIGTEQDSIYFSSLNGQCGWQGLRIENSGSDDTLSYCVVENVDASFGNAPVLLFDSDPQISHSTLRNNHSAFYGGAIYLFKSAAIINHCIFRDNVCSATDGAGALHLFNSSPTLTNLLFFRNKSHKGGAIYAYKSSLILNNVTITDNSALNKGGAIFLADSNYLEIYNSIIWHNLAGLDSSITLIKSAQDRILFHYSDIDTSSWDWLGGGSINTARTAFRHGKGNINFDPLFADPMQSNYALGLDSPCIDSGDPYADYSLEPQPNGERINMGVHGGTCSAAISGMEDISAVKTHRLEQNYPNPFNSMTTISYELPLTNKVELCIFNLLGQKVTTLVNKKQITGIYQIDWNAGKIASGIYYYQLVAGDYREVKKMILLR